MEVILLEKVDNLGNIGDLVKVRSGYGRNYLLPKGKAALATPANIAALEESRAELERKESKDLVGAQARGAEVQRLELKLTAKAGVEGKLFGSIGTIDIAAQRNSERAQAWHRRKDLVPNRRIELHALVHLSPGLDRLDGERDRRDAAAHLG